MTVGIKLIATALNMNQHEGILQKLLNPNIQITDLDHMILNLSPGPNLGPDLDLGLDLALGLKKIQKRTGEEVEGKSTQNPGDLQARTQTLVVHTKSRAESPEVLRLKRDQNTPKREKGLSADHLQEEASRELHNLIHFWRTRISVTLLTKTFKC